MTLTIERALQEITQELGDVPAIQMRPMLDEAGRKLVGLRDWNWMVRPSVTIAGVAAQTYMALPADFKQILAIRYTSSLSAQVIQTDLNQISLYRSVAPFVPGYLIFVCPTWAPDANGIPVPRLEVHPPPSSSNATLLTMFYRAKWPGLAQSDNALVPVPDFMESVYRQFVRATARGYDDSETMSARIGNIMQGPDWLAAVRQDDSQQYDFGAPMSGAMQMASPDMGGDWLLHSQVLPPGPP
jgi:hypothetical protein